MTNRVVKQVLYGSFFTTFILGFSLLIYAVFIMPKPTCFDGIRNQNETDVDCGGKCLACEVKELDLIVTDKRIIPVSAIGKTTFFVRIVDPSVDFWVENFEYALRVYNSLGVVIKEYRGNSIVPPGGERVIVQTAEDFDPSEVKKIDFDILDERWNSIDEYGDPGIRVNNIQTVMQGKKIITTGTVKNNSADLVPILKIVALYKDEKGNITNVSSTVVDNLAGFSTRNFQVVLLPGNENIVFNKTDVLTEIQK